MRGPSPGFETCAAIFSMAASTFSSATSSKVWNRTRRFSRFRTCSSLRDRGGFATHQAEVRWRPKECRQNRHRLKASALPMNWQTSRHWLLLNYTVANTCPGELCSSPAQVLTDPSAGEAPSVSESSGAGRFSEDLRGAPPWDADLFKDAQKAVEFPSFEDCGR